MNCIYTGEELASNTQAEHILQCSFGARWKMNTISCNRVQDAFGEGIDKELASKFSFFQNLLGLHSERTNGPRGTDMFDSKGHKYRMKNGKISLAGPIIGEEEAIDSTTSKITVYAGSKEHIGWAKHKVLQSLPAGSKIVEEQKEELIKVDVSNIGRLSSHLVINGIPCMKGILKSCFNLLGANNHKVAELPCFNTLRKLLLSNDIDSQIDSFCQVPNDCTYIDLPKIGLFDHLLVVFAYAGKVMGFARFYGHLCYSMRLTDVYDGENFIYAYQVDPLGGREEKAPNIDTALLPKFDDAKGENPPFEPTTVFIQRLLSDYTLHMLVNSALDELWARHKDEEIITEAMAKELSELLIQKFLPFIDNSKFYLPF